MEDYVRLREVKKIYKMGEVEIAAADGIDFSVGKGEFAVVVGASGAGKTTVLNILGGMDTATSGEVIVDGNDIGISKMTIVKVSENAPAMTLIIKIERPNNNGAFHIFIFTTFITLQRIIERLSIITTQTQT